MSCTSVQVTELVVYPIKSCGSLPVSEFTLGENGPMISVSRAFVGDREWMIVNPAGEMFTQRKYSKMSLLALKIEGSKLLLQVSGQDFEIPLGEVHSRRLEVDVFGTKIDAGVCDTLDLNRALSSYLGTECLLVHFDQNSQREAKKKGVGVGVQTRFTDSSPYLIFSEESIQDLNEKIAASVSDGKPMARIGAERFRGNIVVKGDKAFGEDEWPTLKKDGIMFENSKACGRCVVTTIDQKLGKPMGPQPLKILNQFRRRENNVFFGQYFITKSFGAILRVGDRLAVV